MIRGLNLPHSFDFVRLADAHIESCASCYQCADKKECMVEDDFQAILQRFIDADGIFIISPVYAPIPSKLSALFERLTSLLFATGIINTAQNPLVGKRAAVFYYSSAKIEDETQIKLVMQKFLMVGYSFHEVNFSYINQCSMPNEKYGGDVVAYVKDTLQSFSFERA